MPVTNYYLPYRSCNAFCFDQLIRLVVGGIPGGLIIGKQVYSMRLGQVGHFPGVLNAYRQGFFDHYVYSQGRKKRYHSQVVVDGAEGRNRLGRSPGH